MINVIKLWHYDFLTLIYNDYSVKMLIFAPRNNYSLNCCCLVCRHLRIQLFIERYFTLFFRVEIFSYK